jgi:hypothetical protein
MIQDQTNKVKGGVRTTGLHLSASQFFRSVHSTDQDQKIAQLETLSTVYEQLVGRYKTGRLKLPIDLSSLETRSKHAEAIRAANSEAYTIAKSHRKRGKPIRFFIIAEQMM